MFDGLTDAMDKDVKLERKGGRRLKEQEKTSKFKRNSRPTTVPYLVFKLDAIRCWRTCYFLCIGLLIFDRIWRASRIA
jgi:hypothetical protein